MVQSIFNFIEPFVEMLLLVFVVVMLISAAALLIHLPFFIYKEFKQDNK